MAKRTKQTAQTPNCKSLKDINVNSVRISRNKNGRKIHTPKSGESSAMPSSTTQPKLNNFRLKLKSFKQGQIPSPSAHIDEVCIGTEENTRSTSNSVRKCVIRLSRTQHRASKDSQSQAAQIQTIPVTTHRLRREQKTKNQRSHNVINQIQEPEKVTQLISTPDTLDDGNNAAIQNPHMTPISARKCQIHLSRFRNSASKDSLKQPTIIHKSPPRKQPKRSEHNKENVKKINRRIQTRASLTLANHANEHDFKSNSLMFVDAAVKASTPLKLSGSIQREPFKVLNLQELVRGTDTNDKCQEILNKQPILTKENRECLRKLSLSGSKYPLKKFDNKNKVVRFKPLRNSTLYEVDLNQNTTAVLETEPSAKHIFISNQLKDSANEPTKSAEKSNDKKNTENSLEKSQNSFKNLANRSDLIEQLLLSDNEEEQCIKPPKQNETTLANKTNKFFHRSPDTTRNRVTKVIKKVQTTKSIRLSSKTRMTQRGKKSIGSVYEFLSQSQTSDSDTAGKKQDPAADIIKKLIAEGKVRVATRKKGTGKLIIKRKNGPKKRVTQKRKKTIKNNVKKVAVNNDDICDDNDYLPYKDIEENPEIPGDPIQNVQETATYPVSSTNHEVSAGGDTFSNLARSVLISETKKNEKRRNIVTYQRKLLEVAQKFVSTPVKKYGPPLDKTAYISPIVSAPQSIANAEEGSSPWRVDDDAHLPSVFYFSRNSANLPSFSSDYIPSSPKKQKHRYQDLLPEPELDESYAPLENPKISQLPIIPNVGVKHSEHSSSLSSFSSNDSNGENKPPAGLENNPCTSGTEYLKTINQRQHLGTRRELSHRSPLQILDVVTLPPWNSKQQFVPEKNDQNASKSNTTLPNDQRKDNKSELFGFEEFLEDDSTLDDLSTNEQETQGKANDSSHKNVLRNKLHHLKHLKPAQKELPSCSASNCIAAVFDMGDVKSANKQLKINEMLCSTMINHGHSNEKMPAKRNKKNNEDKAVAEQLKKQPTELFIDPEPGTSFHENDSLRTYVRPYKRKRKLRHNFVMFLDSDESGDDDDAHQKRHSDTSKELEVEQKKKKHKREQKENVELNSFMNEFNDMCKEVDGYELIIE